MILSLTVHEWAHAFSAWKLGDDTALREGRLTLNPLVHIDPVGTLLLPLLGVPFGWAKPVPVNPARFRRDVNMSTGMAITAFAGPLSNLVLAILCAVGLGVLIRAEGQASSSSPFFLLLLSGLQLNVALALFNLLPIYPLDGSRVVERFVPYRLRDQWETFKRFSPLVLMGVLVLGGGLLAGPQAFVRGLLIDLVRAIVGR
ncbi:MAG: site-2 protease family protein [Myxococcaceae bacterium]|nr:site-2 protease family protein [Myxococcaceae bacterium]